MTEYTPTEAQVRQLYANSMDPAGFDRWLAEVRREAAEKAWGEGYASGHSRAMRRMSDEPNVEPGTNPYRKKETT